MNAAAGHRGVVGCDADSRMPRSSSMCRERRTSNPVAIILTLPGPRDIIMLLSYGAVAQLGERFPRTEEVASSNLASSTIKNVRPAKQVFRGSIHFPSSPSYDSESSQ